MGMEYRKEIRLDGYTKELLEALKRSKRFGSEAAIIRLAVQDLAKTELPRLKRRFSSDERNSNNAEVGRLTQSGEFCEGNLNNRLAATISAGEYNNNY